MSLRGPVPTPTTEARRAEFTGGWMDGMGWDGWDGMGWGIKSVLQFSLYFVCIYILYLTSYICSQNLSPTSLWVSKFDVKLGVVIKIFKITAGRWFFIFWPKSSLFFFTSRWEAFFCEKLKKDGSWSKISNLQQVRDFSFFGSKSSLLQGLILK